MTEEVVPTLPATLSIGEEGGAGAARIPNASLKLVFRSGETIVGECTYTSNVNFSYEFGSNLLFHASAVLSKVSGGYALCAKTMNLSGGYDGVLWPNTPIVASSEAPKEGSHGLFRNSAGSRLAMFAGEEVLATSKNLRFDFPTGGNSKCVESRLKGGVTTPSGLLAQAKLTEATFSGCTTTSPGQTVTGARYASNISESWPLNFSEKSGSGELQGPVKITVEELVFGIVVSKCPYEASGVPFTYSPETALAITLSPTKFTLESGGEKGCNTGEFGTSGTLSGAFTATAYGTPVEVLP